MDMKFTVVLRKGEDGWYVVECPALPGCVSQGKTVKEALANIKEAIEGWLEVANERSKSKVAFEGKVLEVVV